jgi:hypothetical protein
MTVYLDERDAAALRRMAAETGRSQASIIREAVHEATRGARRRIFSSHGIGRGTGEPVGRQDKILSHELARFRR